MRNLGILVLVIGLFIFPLMAQDWEQDEGEINEFVIGHVPTAEIGTMAVANPYVKALCIGLANYFPNQSEWAALDFATKWYSNQDWNILFIVVNHSSWDAAIKVEFEMLYDDGGIRYYKKSSKTIKSGNIVLYYLDVTSRIAKKGLFTVNGRIHGAGIGNDNQVKSQVYIY